MIFSLLLQRWLAVLVVGFAALSVNANDSTARLGVGGLELTKSKSIRMVDEFLRISPKSVYVRYQFHNDKATDISSVVAFPMPRFWWNPGESQLDSNVGRLDRFQTFVEGKLIKTQIETKAWLGNQDISRTMRNIGFADRDMIQGMSCSVADIDLGTCLPPRLIAGLKKRLPKALSEGQFPEYEVQETAWWEQRFPAKSALKVEHTYPPKVGHSHSVVNAVAGAEFVAPMHWGPGRENDIESARVACLHEGATHALKRRVEQMSKLNDGAVSIILNDVEYVLGTGRNWKAPIEYFVLHVVKEQPDQIVSLCFPGKARKVSDLILEFRAKNFTPQDALVIYFYTVATAGQLERANAANSAQ